jgi:hypothetical protein
MFLGALYSRDSVDNQIAGDGHGVSITGWRSAWRERAQQSWWDGRFPYIADKT